MTPPSPPTAAAHGVRVDYRETSRRPAWDSLPADVHEAVGAAVGSRVVEGAAPVTTGFTGAYAGRDWNWLCTGPAWVDLVGLMPLMALDGLDTGALMAMSPLTRDADPEHVDAFLAAVTVYMSGNLDAPPPPGCTPALRHHQHHMAGAFLALLADRRGWAV